MFQHGFLGYDASFMLDFVVSALIAILPIQIFSLYLVKVKRNFLLHRNIQLFLGITLLIAVSAFEIDMQIVHGGWRNVVNKNPDIPRLSEETLAGIQQVLQIHLVFAISTPIVWGLAIYLALRRYPSPPVPGPHSRIHKPLGWLAVIDIIGTSVTGLWFYYVAFVVNSVIN